MPNTTRTLLRRWPARLFPILIAAVLMLGMAGCQGKNDGPYAAVSAYLDTVVKTDTAAGNAYLMKPTVEGDLFLNGREAKIPSTDLESLNSFKKSITKIWNEMTYRIKGTTVTGETAVVAVEITMADLSMLERSLSSAAFDNMDASPAQQDLLVTQALVGELEAATAEGAARMVRTVRLELQLVDGTWMIADHLPLGRELIGNIAGMLLPSS